MELRFHAVRDQFGRIFTIQPVHFAVNQGFQILHGIFDGGGE